jgi:hypothetical protein
MKSRLILFVLAAALFAGCAAPRYEALEQRQDGVDARHNSRMDRRDLRSERADARYGRW